MTETVRFVSHWRRAGLGSSLTVDVAGNPITLPISSYGPGDIVGIDPGMILRTTPDPASMTFTPNLFVAIEFRDADLPWRLTPAAPDGDDRLTPWLAVVVVEQAGGSLAQRPGGALPVLAVDASQLPALAESWAWAHVQVSGDDTQSVAEILENQRERCVSRLMCPRQLAPTTRYVACLVPTFEAGRLAGLGLAVPDARSPAPAWTTGEITLPVYASWTFTTGEAGDFETLARRLRPDDLASREKPWRLDLGSVVNDAGSRIATMPSALRPVGRTLSWPEPGRSQAHSKLEGWLTEADEGHGVVGPPRYGALPAADQSSAWLDQLGHDPRYRAVAALGAELVRRDQEPLVADAWRQLGDLRRINRERDGAAISTLVTERLAKRHLAPLGNGVVAVSAIAWTRIRHNELPVARAVADSPLPEGMASPVFRRTVASRIPRAIGTLAAAVARENERSIAIGGLTTNPSELVTPSKIRHGAPPPHGPSIPIPHSIREAAERLNARVVRAREVRRPRAQNLDALAATIASSLRTSTAPARLAARLDLGDTVPQSTTAPIAADVEVIYPIAPRIVELDRRYLLGGVDPALDTVGVLEFDPAFVEAVLIGANHELIRELQWRGAPIDRRATPFRQFFDPRGTSSGDDIDSIGTWSAPSDLGSHLQNPHAATILIRGDLVRKFPDCLIYVAKAGRDQGVRSPSTERRLPRFRNTIGADMLFAGFDLTVDQLRDEDQLGWYIVIAEHAGAPRFGLDEPGTTEVFQNWNDIAWPDAARSDVSIAGDHISVADSLPAPIDPGLLVWGRSASDMAAITFQRPVSIAIHASTLLRRPS